METLVVCRIIGKGYRIVPDSHYPPRQLHESEVASHKAFVGDCIVDRELNGRLVVACNTQKYADGTECYRLQVAAVPPKPLWKRLLG